MYIYIVRRKDEVDYDEYDGAVVAANSPEEAVKILPRYPENWRSWHSKEEPDIFVKLIGTTDQYLTSRLILASFMAG